jgi:hypothetical protein
MLKIIAVKAIAPTSIQISGWLSKIEKYREGLEYFRRSPKSHKRRQKRNPVSNETVGYGLKHCGTWTRVWQRW